jgi:phosphoglycerate dehydrogenase-like enzyme
VRPEPVAPPVVAVEPKSGRFESLEQAVVAGGAVVGAPEEASALVWADAHAAPELPAVLARGPGITWVALPFAGIEPYVPYLDDQRTWTCAKGVYARPVAEHVLAMGLAGLRGLVHYGRATSWQPPRGSNLVDGRVTVFGAGGITAELIELLAPFRAEVTVVRRRPDPVPGAARVVGLDRRLDAVRGADLVVLALALTAETRHVIGVDELAAMASHAWLVNVARGGHVDTDALVAALDAGAIGGAALDVTDPEPLPAGHRLWGHERCLVTPHVGNTPEMGVPLLARHIEANVARFVRGEALDGLVDVGAGY